MGKLNRQQARHAGRTAVKTAKAAKKGAKSAVTPKAAIPILARKIAFDNLTDREQRGYALFAAWKRQNNIAVPWGPESTWWLSSKGSTRPYEVKRSVRNRRGQMEIVYACQCDDFEDVGRVNCKHIFAERLRRGEVVVTGAAGRPPKQKARRRPARRRVCQTGPHKGKQIRTVQKHARNAMPGRIPLLATSLVAEAEHRLRTQAIEERRQMAPADDWLVIPKRKQKHQGGRIGTPLTMRAAALVIKVANKKSYDEMQSEYEQLIERGVLRLAGPPCQNRLSEWMNDERITPILHRFLRVSSYPFLQQEIGAIVDSTKMSQLMNTSAMGVDYLGDERDNADWVKAHTIVGVETMVIMDVMFSNMHAHDINFIEPLVESALRKFPLEYVLGDKAYLSEDVLKFFWARNIKAAIPVKKKYWDDQNKAYSAPIQHLVDWYDNRQRDFHEVYRLRPKIEALFSLVKRMAAGHCWSHGRDRTNLNPLDPSTAWKNEILCKLIYTNLRTTVSKEEEFGIKVDYLVPQRWFGAPTDPLLADVV